MTIQLHNMIKHFRKQHKMTLEELGEKMDKSKSALSRWEKGDRSPMVDDLVKLAHIFNTDVLTLLFGLEHHAPKITKTIDLQTQRLAQLIKQLSPTEKKETIAFMQNLVDNRTTTQPLFPVSVVEAVAAGRGYSYGNNETTTYYTTRDNLKAFDLASLVSGDSMEPDIHNGDVILMQTSPNHISGQIYAVDYNEQSFVKKVYFEKDNLRLVSLNEKYDDIIIPYDTPHYVNIVGHVVDWFTPVTP